MLAKVVQLWPGADQFLLVGLFKELGLLKLSTLLKKRSQLINNQLSVKCIVMM